MIKDLENEIYKSRKNLNNILVLFDYIDLSNHSIDEVNDAAAALCRVYCYLSRNGLLKRPKEDDSSANAQVKNWVCDNYINYTEKLTEIFSMANVEALQVSFLTMIMRLCKAESQMDENGTFRNQFYIRFCLELLSSSQLSDICIKDFVTSYLVPYDDVRFFFYKNSKKVISSLIESSKTDDPMANLDIVAFNTIRILSAIPSPLPSSSTSSWADEPSPSSTETSSIKRAFQESWLSALSLPLSVNLYKQVLNVIHKRVIPFLQKPNLLMDFLTDAYNSHHAVSLLALNGLFTLMISHNLDYPLFYPKLYALLDRNLLYLKTRSRFFRLLDLFLSSTHLPATLIASFIKRLARLALTAPPGAIAIVIPFIYNCLQRHPTCMQMLHRSSAESGDSFDFDQPDPLLTGAIESSLWELSTLQNHYYSNIASLASIMSQKFTKPRYELEDFLDHGYATMCDAELRRPLKNEPPIEFEKRTLASGLEKSWI